MSLNQLIISPALGVFLKETYLVNSQTLGFSLIRVYKLL